MVPPASGSGNRQTKLLVGKRSHPFQKSQQKRLLPRACECHVILLDESDNMPCRRLLTDLLPLEAGRFSLLPPEVGGSDCIIAKSLGGKQEQATAAKFALAKARRTATGRHVRKATKMATAGQGHERGPRYTQDQGGWCHWRSRTRKTRPYV